MQTPDLGNEPRRGKPSPSSVQALSSMHAGGDFLNGKMVLGTSGGVFEVLKVEDTDDDAVTPELDVTTPLLWHGSLEATKETNNIIIQAAGVENSS